MPTLGVAHTGWGAQTPAVTMLTAILHHLFKTCNRLRCPVKPLSLADEACFVG